MIKSIIESKNRFRYNRQTVSRRPLPLDVSLMLKSRKQAITNIKDIAGLILKLEKDKIEIIEKLESKLNKISEKEKEKEQDQEQTKKKRNILL